MVASLARSRPWRGAFWCGGSLLIAGCCHTRCAPATLGRDEVVAAPRSTPSQRATPRIVLDQFGYRSADEKIAVIRCPVRGFDADPDCTHGDLYALVRASDQAKLLEAAPRPWNGGAVDPSSGDKAWWFDFSAIAAPGDYYVLDETHDVRSDAFRIADDVYRDVLVQAARVLYYQRDGIAKDAKFAGADWADGPAHMGPGQDLECRQYEGKTTKDLHGGWFDAGDQNKYTSWAANDCIALLRAYRETPDAFSDDYNVPESGNGVPDLLDEVKWELDWIGRMQNDDGSVLSIVGQDGATSPEFGGSPNTAPSTATGPCTYGPATTAATFTSAAAFSLAAMIFGAVRSASAAYPGYSDALARRAERAWAWADAHPSVVFKNSGKIGAGEQEVDDAGRLTKRLQAAALLFALSGDTKYRDAFDANYTKVPLVASGYVDLFAAEQQDALLEYTLAPRATTGVVRDIVGKYMSGLLSDHNLGALRTNADPYLAFLHAYTWGSNSSKANQGNVFADVPAFGIDLARNAEALRGAERYVHYIHGLNPLGLVYLSNMGAHGAERSATRFFHSWFAHGSNWDAVGVSLHAPPPGFLVGGPNIDYTWDSCCPARCSGRGCGTSPPSPPAGQPAQKAYRDFNEGWPIDSWSVTEPDVGYQANYLRLLSKFVK
jgi:endoglucanase